MATTDAVPFVEGDLEWEAPSAGKPIKTHYWVYGDLKSGKTPLVGLHGGPGIPRAYMTVLRDLTKAHGIPLILYDQIGNGLSTHLPEKKGDVSFWTVELFVKELEHVLTHLGVQDNFDLYGHSWGGMLATAYAVRQPKGLKRLVLASSIAKMQDWIDATVYLRGLLPKDVLEVLEKHEAAGTVTSPEYAAAEKAYYDQFVCRIESKELGESFAHLIQDPTVYFTMLGPNEFTIIGPLKDFDLTNELSKINVPTLLTNGRWDGAQDSVVKPFWTSIPKVKWAHFATSSHLPQLEERERYMDVVGSFLETH
ncbi:Alpha/Beta hydrolase protein [Cristinia sonorae]|uniref:Alpha/Beta hydrolase protein n=1 Tax=Cristinia sonorae TaxID=1940300 RepID=A0A8K0UN03_9AGAR|nr:Alpha/Beta hydrolase protein [Cristinia sonorae]